MNKYLFFAVDSKYKDFIVFNADKARELNNETVKEDDIEFIEIKNIDELKSIAWSSNCKWFFVIQSDCILLVNVYKDLAVRCKQKSWEFFRMYLDGY